MKYRKLGNTGFEVSEIGYGTWGLGGNSYGDVNDSQAKACLRLALDKGVNFFDTSDLYGNGHSETLLAQVIREVREKVVIATKGGTLPHSGFQMPQDFSPDYLKKALEGSLKRLQTDYIDLYQLHSPRLEDINDELLKALQTFKSDGKIRAYGISVRSPSDAVQIIDKWGFEVFQINYNMIDQRSREAGFFARARELNVGVIVRTPLVFGYLTGALSGEEEFRGIDHRANWPREQLKRWADAPKLFVDLNRNKTRTTAQLALLFCLWEDAVSTVIPGMMNITEVEEDIRASELPCLTNEEIDSIKQIYISHDFYDKHAKQIGSKQ